MAIAILLFGSINLLLGYAAACFLLAPEPPRFDGRWFSGVWPVRFGLFNFRRGAGSPPADAESRNGPAREPEETVPERHPADERPSANGGLAKTAPDTGPCAATPSSDSDPRGAASAGRLHPSTGSGGDDPWNRIDQQRAAVENAMRDVQAAEADRLPAIAAQLAEQLAEWRTGLDPLLELSAATPADKARLAAVMSYRAQLETSANNIDILNLAGKPGEAARRLVRELQMVYREVVQVHQRRP